MITDAAGNTIANGDFVAMIGHHIADTAHSDAGVWNEIHPIEGVAKILEAEYSAVPVTHTSNDIYDRYCAALKAFKARVGVTRQALVVGGSGTGGGGGNVGATEDEVGLPRCLEHEAIG